MFKPIEIENVIEKDYQKQILDVVTDITFDWHFMEDTTFEKTDTLNRSTPSFANLVYHPNNKENPGLEFFTPLLHISRLTSIGTVRHVGTGACHLKHSMQW